MGKASARQRLAGVAQHMRPVACQPVARVSREESAEDGWVPSTQCVVPKTAIVTTPFNNSFFVPVVVPVTCSRVSVARAGTQHGACGGAA
eukprot:COSAG03_NODE_1313_length_4344_cov_17.169140_3_plen_90_part_00